MKFGFALVSVLAVVLLSGAEGGNAPHQLLYDASDYVPPAADHGLRQRRVTCDLLNFNTPWGSFGHSLCAAHCLAHNKGFRGGYCDGNGVCNCRY